MTTVPRDKARASASWQLLLCALVGTLLVAGCFAFALGVAREAPPGLTGRDLVWYFVPAFGHVKLSLAAGELPLWNPWQLAGMPFIATAQPAVFYPTTIPLAVAFEPTLAVTLQCAISLVLAGVLAFGCARALGMSALAASITALAYAGSGPLLGEVYNPVVLATRAWLPGVFWLLLLLVSRPGAATAAGLALAVACTFAAGHAQGFVYIGYSAVAFGAFAFARNPEQQSRLRIAGFALLAAALAAGLVAAQLLPTLELASRALRGVTGIRRGWAILGTRDAGLLFDTIVSGEGDVGLFFLTIPLAAMALLAARTRVPALFCLVLSVLVLDFIRGDSGICFPLAERYLGAGSFRFASRIAFVFQFAAALLLGLGSESLASAIGMSRPRVATALLASVVVLVGGERIATNLPSEEFLPASRPQLLDGPRELVEFADGGREEGRLLLEGKTSGWRVSRNLGQRHGVPVANAYDPFIPQDYADFFATADLQRWFGNVGVKTPGLQPFRDPRLSQDPRLLDLLSVRWLSIVERYPQPSRYEDVGEAALSGGGFPGRPLGDLIVHERVEARPRAFVVGKVLEVPDAQTAISKVRAFAFDPAKEAVVWRPSDLPPDLFTDLADDSVAGSVSSFESTTNTVTVRASCTRRCLLVVTDLFYPGWQARVGQRKLAIVPANGIFRAVVLEAGDHELHMRYAPASFRAGMAISGGTFLLILGCLVAARRERIRSTRAQRV